MFVWLLIFSYKLQWMKRKKFLILKRKLEQSKRLVSSELIYLVVGDGLVVRRVKIMMESWEKDGDPAVGR